MEAMSKADYYCEAIKASRDKAFAGAQLYVEDFIPTGRRACCFHLFQCDSCSNRSISVVDFLKVRDQKLIKGGDVYPYEKFSSMLCDR